MTGPLLQDKVVVLSGVGPGLGRALGEEAAKMGADLVLVSRTERRLEKMAEVVRSHGRRALVVPTDITDEDARTRARRRGARRVRPGRLPDQQRVRDPADGPAHHPRPRRACATPTRPTCSRRCGSRRCSPTRWPSRRTGRSSCSTPRCCYSSQPEYAGYKLSKGALAHLASSLATELGPRGIRVNSVAPSYIYEDVNKAYFDWLAAEQGVTHEDIYREKAEPTDLKRLATPDEVAQAALFLASDLASAVTGIVLNVDCGEFHDN